jgi:hypothetical protein
MSENSLAFAITVLAIALGLPALVRAVRLMRARRNDGSAARDPDYGC